MKPTHKIVALLFIVTIPVACSDAPANVTRATEVADSVPAAVVIDSILPIGEEIRRFREGVGEAASELGGGAGSRDALVAGLMQALESGDTAYLASAVVGAAEFIGLYFPSSIYTRPPYEMDPAAIWFQMQNNSSRGLSRAMTRYGSRHLGFRGYTCSAEPLVEGENRIWEECVVQIGSGADAGEVRLFGPIIERAGHFNFLTYSNGL